jgi:hypothetical protein
MYISSSIVLAPLYLNTQKHAIFRKIFGVLASCQDLILVLIFENVCINTNTTTDTNIVLIDSWL